MALSAVERFVDGSPLVPPSGEADCKGGRGAAGAARKEGPPKRPRLASWHVPDTGKAAAERALDARLEDGDGVYAGEVADTTSLAKDGFGVKTYPDGTRYAGRWSGDTGAGGVIDNFPTLKRYGGELQDGLITGYGVATDYEGKLKEGYWEAGVLVSWEPGDRELAHTASDRATTASRHADRFAAEALTEREAKLRERLQEDPGTRSDTAPFVACNVCRLTFPHWMLHPCDECKKSICEHHRKANGKTYKCRAQCRGKRP